MGQPLFRRRISEAFVRLLHEYVQAQGADAEQVLGAPRPAWPPQESGGIAISLWVRLLERASRHFDDPLLGLHLGRTMTPSHLGTFGYLLQSMPTLADTLQKLERYQRLVYDQTPMTRHFGDGHVDLVWGPEQGLPGRLADDTSITTLIHYCRTVADGAVTPQRVQFINNPPPDARPYVECYGCPVEFGTAVTSVRFDLRTLALPLKAADAKLSALMERQAERMLAQLPEESPFIQQMRAAAARLLHEGEPDLPRVAAGLGVNARTVQRRLREAGSGFRQELETVRRLLAETYLRDPRLSVADVAQLLGYSEHSAFSRSYRQWTGLTPQAWREGAGAPTRMRRT
jgi:AraC-like DNA-binding protein